MKCRTICSAYCNIRAKEGLILSKITAERKKYLKEYIQDKYTTIHLSFHKVKDKELLEHLNGKGNRIAYIRKLVEEDMSRLTRMG